MKIYFIGLATAIVIVTLSACAMPQSTGLLNSVDKDIEFIDLDIFDLSLTENMRRGSELVTVSFPNQEASINELPNRLQRWLSAVHVHGGGVSVETEDGLQQKDLGTLVALMVSGYKLAVKAVPVIMSKSYKAVIITDSGKVDRIEFSRI